MSRIVVLASGRGSNFEAIAQARDAGKLSCEIAAVISDKKDAPVLERARARGIQGIHVPIPPRSGAHSGASASPLLDAIRSVGSVQWVVLAGYMRLLSADLLRAFDSGQGYSRVVNVHPSLLPAFPGLEGYAQAFDYGCAQAGVTVHLVTEALDSGPIAAQEAFSIADCTSAQEVERRGLAIEHRLYPETLSWLLGEKFKIETRPQGRICVRKS